MLQKSNCDVAALDKPIKTPSKFNTIRKHELEHARIASDYWNQFVDETKLIEALKFC